MNGINLSVLSHSDVFRDPKLVRSLRALTNPPSVGSGMKIVLNEQRTGTYILARLNNKLVGWAFLCDRVTDENAQLAVFVHPKCRGKGIGSAIVSQAILSSQKPVTVQPWSEPGRRLYSRFGLSTAPWEYHSA
jgi:GNAT superfamily N-acetyltransferase